jgi:hypothetical protein
MSFSSCSADIQSADEEEEMSEAKVDRKGGPVRVFISYSRRDADFAASSVPSFFSALVPGPLRLKKSALARTGKPGSELSWNGRTSLWRS